MFENFGAIQANSGQSERVLTYVKNERMGGFVPKYEVRQKTDSLAPQDIGQSIENAIVGSQGSDDLLAYQATQNNAQNDDQFGFADMLDMVNPLHHIPVVGHVYRELSGDEISPMSRIIGGAAFGGPIGAASALIDTVIQKETGNDAMGNALNLAFNTGSTPPLTQDKHLIQSPERAIENAIATANDTDLASTLLAFSDLSAKDEATLKFEARQRAQQSIQSPIEREAITTLSVNASGKSGLYAL